MPYLLDSGILLRLVNRSDSLHALVRAAVRTLQSQGETLLTASQNVAEFWNVWTRPLTARGGLGRSPAEAAHYVRLLERRIQVVTDTPSSYALWKQLVVSHAIVGVQVHDARLVAIVQTRAISQVLTLNPTDFRRYSGVIAVTPQSVMAPAPP
jgi:predicted nucleic acid-binding protein